VINKFCSSQKALRCSPLGLIMPLENRGMSRHGRALKIDYQSAAKASDLQPKIASRGRGFRNTHFIIILIRGRALIDLIK
jgi:hypothetical protein